MVILLTGGAGFIGSAVVRQLIAETDATVVNVDKLTYAGNLNSLASARHDPRHIFERVDICDAGGDRPPFRRVPARRRDAPRRRVARRSIDRRPRRIHPHQHRGHVRPAPGRPGLLAGLGRAVQVEIPVPSYLDRRGLWLARRRRAISPRRRPTRRTRPIRRARPRPTTWSGRWHHTYDLPVLVTNCSNNYGPYQFPEKLIPLIILNALRRQAVAGLRQGGQRPRLALRRRPRRGLAAGPGERRGRRDLQHRRPQRAAEPRSCADHLPAARRASARFARTFRTRI